jgi:hypothetical protein
MKPMIEYSPPEKGLKAGNTSATSTPVMPAIALARANANAESLMRSTPTIWIASRFMIAARSALPGRVRNRNQVSAADSTRVTPSATRRAVDT